MFVFIITPNIRASSCVRTGQQDKTGGCGNKPVSLPAFGTESKQSGGGSGDGGVGSALSETTLRWERIPGLLSVFTVGSK